MTDYEIDGSKIEDDLISVAEDCIAHGISYEAAAKCLAIVWAQALREAAKRVDAAADKINP